MQAPIRTWRIGEVGRGHGREIPTDDREDRPVGQCQQVEASLVHRFAPRRIDLQQMEHFVSAEREHHDDDKSDEYCEGAAADAARPAADVCCCAIGLCDSPFRCRPVRGRSPVSRSQIDVLDMA